PTELRLAAISRPWRVIHTLCQPSIATATNSTVALKISWPRPDAAAASTSANAATTSAPSVPPTIPYVTHAPLPSTPRVAARTMLTTSAASSTSRRTMTAVASTVIPGRLLCDDAASGGFFVELADELVSSRLERPHRQGRFALAGDDFFQLEVMAFEFFGGRVEIFNEKLETLARR